MQDYEHKTTGQALVRSTTAIPEPVVSQSFHQLGMFVNDGSGSMYGQAQNGMRKNECVGVATAETFRRFQASTKRSNFSFAIVDFDDSAKQSLDITAAAALDPNRDYTPDAPGSGGTSIAAGLEQAEAIANTFLNAKSEVAKSVVIVVLSDGMDGSAEHTLQIAKRLKARGNIVLCTCFLADQAGHDATAENHLRAIASDPVSSYRTVHDAETIRNFFMASLSAGKKL